LVWVRCGKEYRVYEFKLNPGPGSEPNEISIPIDEIFIPIEE
jgi:hypothetical protein